MARGEIDDPALEAKPVTRAGDDDPIEVEIGARAGDRMGEILEDEECLRA